MNRLVILSLNHGVIPGQADLSPGSNAWYSRNYESYFDEVHCIALMGKFKGEIRNGKTIYSSLGSGNRQRDLILAPIRFYSILKKLKPEIVITYEQVWLWWVVWLGKLFRSVKIYLLPVTIPAVMYKVTGKSLSGILPKWIEQFSIRLSYKSCNYAVTTSGVGEYVTWLQSDKTLKTKLKVVAALPETVPPPSFFDQLHEAQLNAMPKTEGVLKLLYVGRLHKEKLVDHLVKMMAEPEIINKSVQLLIIGDGKERINLEKLASQLQISNSIQFLGYKPNNELPKYYIDADIFVSPLTGCSLREAAFCDLPIVAYDMDWVKNTFTDGKDFMAAMPYNHSSMAKQVSRLVSDKALKSQLSINVKELALNLWSRQALKNSLAELFRKE